MPVVFVVEQQKVEQVLQRDERVVVRAVEGAEFLRHNLIDDALGLLDDRRVIKLSVEVGVSDSACVTAGPRG